MMEIFQINIKKEENKKMNVELGRERERELQFWMGVLSTLGHTGEN